MTSDDLVLDWASLGLPGHTVTLYRIARKKYANLSGAGAAIAPGRWNKQGQEAIYTSFDKSTPILEKLVHLQKDLIPSNLALMTINSGVPRRFRTGENDSCCTGDSER